MHDVQTRQFNGTVPEDDEIKVIARTNRQLAIEWVVRKYRRPLYHHALYVLKDPQAAYDAAQEVFIKALRERRFFQPEFKMRAWLFRVTSNLCFNQIRNRKRRAAILDAHPPARSSDARQADVVLAGQRQERILAALGRLTRNHSEILSLRYYSDLSYAEISDVLDIKLGTVMSRLSRAKTALVEVLDTSGVE